MRRIMLSQEMRQPVPIRRIAANLMLNIYGRIRDLVLT